MITLDNLTQDQVTMCDLLWECETQAEVDRFMQTLSEPQRCMAQTLTYMMIQETAEDMLADDNTCANLLNNLIAKSN